MFRYIIILVLLVFAWFVVYFMNGTNAPFAHFFYFPIIVAGLFLGIKGGITVGVIAGVLTGPLMPEHVGDSVSQPLSFWLARLGFFVVFGGFAGKLFSSLNRKTKQVFLQKEDLEIKNKEITEQRDEINKKKCEIEKQRDEIEDKNEEIRQIGFGMVEALVKAIEVRDSYTSGHCQRVSDMSVRIGERMGLEQQELVYLKWSGMLHDIGKIGIPEEILNKEGRLTDYEYDVMKQHPALGAKILSDVPHAEHILEGVLHHHERMDGKGYPEALSGDDIGLQARILAVSDVWDALTSKRAYREAMLYPNALQIMESGRGSQFDPVVLDHFLKIIGEDYKKETMNQK
jgi:HD-GYP domain-containing protein (c-di-GMP phosphodiesterase class II)